MSRSSKCMDDVAIWQAADAMSACSAKTSTSLLLLPSPRGRPEWSEFPGLERSPRKGFFCRNLVG